METVKEKQLGGCMAGFFNIFDRPHILSPKRLSSSSSSSPVSFKSESETASPLIQPPTPSIYSTPELRSPAPLTLPVMESRSPWRFSKEAPRLSLDSRQIQRQGGSPSVIARLMGLDPLPPTPLQRSASESRVTTRDYRFLDTFNVQHSRDEDWSTPPPAPPPRRCIAHARPKSFFDSTDFFPEPRERASKTTDLQTLKQLLEALRLKGLLHSSNRPPRHSNLVFESPIRPTRSPGHLRQSRDSSPSGIRSRSPAATPKRDRGRYLGDQNSVNRRPVLNQQRRWRRHDDERTPLAAQEEMDDYNRQGKTLLERCDKLLHSIAEMAAAASEAGGDSQPSPVSVLDYHDDSSPSPVMKRTLHFPDSEDDSVSSLDSDYVYISDILRASDCLPRESDVFSLLEKQQYLKGKCSSRAAAQERRLIFDAVQEILGRRRRLPPWRLVGEGDQMQLLWSEFQKFKQSKCGRDEEDLLGYVSGVLGRDLSEDPWQDCPIEMSEAVLDIERLIYKDVIGDTIHSLAALNWSDSLRRRLVF